MDSGAQDGLFDEGLVERVEPAGEDVVETGAGVNKRFKPFDPDAVMLVPPSLDVSSPGFGGEIFSWKSGLVDQVRFAPPWGRKICCWSSPDRAGLWR